LFFFSIRQFVIKMNDRRVCCIFLLVTAMFLTAIHLLGNNFKERLSFNYESSIFNVAVNKEAESMSAEEVYGYLHWTNSVSCHFAVDFGFGLWIGLGIAAPDGHKAVCLDQIISPVYNNCLVYSFGINHMWTFDEAMELYKCQVFSFDPSMNVKTHDRSPYIHFYNIGLAGENRLDPTTGWNLKTATSIYQMLSSRHGANTPIDVLKMDIEFSEWEALPEMLQSGFLAGKVKQLVVEIHFDADDSLEMFRERTSVLKALESNSSFSHINYGGFVRFSSRPNPGLKRPILMLKGKQDYIGLELAWYNSRFYQSFNNINDENFFPYYD
jgi:hypothetical protein